MLRTLKGEFISLVTTHRHGFGGCRVLCFQASELHARSMKLR